MSAGAKGLRGHILISHTHWDHIQGIPFFAPLFVPDNEWDIYGPKGLGQSLRETLAGQMQYNYFPVTLDQCEAKIRYHDLVEGTFDIVDREGAFDKVMIANLGCALIEGNREIGVLHLRGQSLMQ